tara:strand:+ start:295 stop:732 length:438 start_codon:yes stop_codon:yes gene_type:complete
MLEGMLKTDLKIIDSKTGSVMHVLKKSDDGFIEFGETYFSSISKNSIRAWKLHTKMTLNLVVPIGKILFCFYDKRIDSSTKNQKFKILLSNNPYFRLTVPPGIWFGFKGVGNSINLVCNISNIVHDPGEVLRKNLDEINIDWSST